ncbi:MAG: hypothetical protein WDN01_02145 [Rhizomicrobium sp.]
MKPRAAFSIVVLLSSLAAGAPACAADFVLYTQNLLRFGHGSRTANKCQAMENASASVDIILIQELMVPAYPCTSVPAGFSFRGFGPLGTSSYKEYYGFLWRSTASTGHPVIAETSYSQQASQSVFIRPPTAMFFKVTTTAGKVHYVWIGNMHSIFGKTVSGRQYEATQAGTFFQSLRGMTVGTQTPPTGGWATIVAGDWNLPITDSAGTTVNAGFTWLQASTVNAWGLPTNTVTSLTRAGAGSSPYDHMLYNTLLTSGTGVTLSSVTLNPPNNTDWPNWRRDVSDHLGAGAEVTIQ